MKKGYLLIALITMCMFLFSCLKALVTCGSVTTLNTDLGYVDPGDLDLGNLLLLNPEKLTLNSWKVLSYLEDDVKLSGSPSTITDNIKSGLSVTLSGAGATNAVSAGVDASLTNQLNFHVVNFSRKEFIDPIKVLTENMNSKIIDECKDANRKGQIVMLVTSMIYGDTSQIYIQKDRAINGNVASQKIGNYTVKVTYNCSGNYEKKGKQVNLFFKPQFFMCDPIKGLIDITNTQVFDLTKYNFVQALNN